jgi:hypothetical protein
MSVNQDARPGAIRIALMSDLHNGFEIAHQRRLEARAWRGESSLIADSLRLRAELRREPSHPDRGPDLRQLKGTGPDFLLMPGDIEGGEHAVQYADAAAIYLGCPTLITAGNHEFYHRDMPTVMGELRTAAAATNGRVHFLEMDRVNLDARGCRIAILGATLWTDYALTGAVRPSMVKATKALNDHHMVRNGDNIFQPADALEIHRKTMKWLSIEMPRARADADVVVVMSHHAPIPEAIPPKYRGDDLSAAFATDLRDQIAAWRPDLWVWGHTHHSVDGRLGATRLVSAPRGYLGVEPAAEAFVPLLLEI